jgi:hypothetical protein
MKRKKKRNPVDFLSGCLGNNGIISDHQLGVCGKPLEGAVAPCSAGNR